MQLEDILMMVGGLALFLYGMQVMSRGLEAAAGDRLRSILEKLTSRRLLGVLVGAGITAVIQSSSATTVMTVGFVNSGLMTLQQAVGVIMGANIGTTVTSQLIALDVGMIAPLVAFAGVLIVMMSKKQKIVCLGEIMAGLGILFLGMNLMSSSMAPLREYEPFVQLLSRFSNPVLGLLAGMAFTALVQSSSASIGILQALAASGVIGLDGAVFVLFGQNIGTCVTALIASMGASRAAKRATLIHLMFNVIGAVFFTLICVVTPFTAWMQMLVPASVPGQIATTHTIFNVVTTLLLLPFGDWMARAACRILPDARRKAPSQPTDFVDEHAIGGTAIALHTLRDQLAEMMALAAGNVQMAFDALLQRDMDKLAQVAQREDQIDLYNAAITRTIGRAGAHEMPPEDSEKLNMLLVLSSNIERIGDHAMNMAEYLAPLEKHGIKFDEATVRELEEMRALAGKALSALDFSTEETGGRPGALRTVSELEAQSDARCKACRKAQIARLRAGETDPELSILYSEMLTDTERMLDHALNIAQALYA